ncbi:MAG: hypothetical protein GX763_02770 [Clostridiaceae bacterium]|nr:hypothetical protein [Clostridiaceae bacterium]
MSKRIGFVAFGEVNTPYEKIEQLYKDALDVVQGLGADVTDGGIVIDDPAYETADAAISKLHGVDMDCLIVCVTGWIPTHAVIRVIDPYRHVPMLLWGLCGWRDGDRIVTTAPQAGTTALRPAMEALGFTFKYVYNIIGKPVQIEKLQAYVDASYAASKLRKARIGTMGYRDMLLYGTQFEGNSLRGEIGVEVEPFEMLEIVQILEELDPGMVTEGVQFVKNNWKVLKPVNDSVIENGVKYALAIGKKIEERDYEAVTLIDVDGMKKLLGFPPAMVFMLLDHYYGVLTVPENDVMGAVMQLMLKYVSGDIVPYMEYYEFFEDSMLIGVPDYIPNIATDGDVELLPTAFGQLSASLLNVSKARKGYVTCARLLYLNGEYKMHLYTGNAEAPPKWEEYGWEAPAPQLPSLSIYPDSCTVEEFAQKVSSQHVIIGYGDYAESLRDLCAILNIEVI